MYLEIATLDQMLINKDVLSIRLGSAPCNRFKIAVALTK